MSQKGYDASYTEGPGQASDTPEHASVARDGLGLMNTVLHSEA